MTIFDGSLENSCTDDFLETIKSHRDEELLACIITLSLRDRLLSMPCYGNIIKWNFIMPAT